MMKIAYIFGSGSIACRHSNILTNLDFVPFCVTNRLITLSGIFHPNSFLKILQYNQVEQDNDNIFIIASNTCEHTKIYNFLLDLGITSDQIYCEKPGPIDGQSCNILYNLEFLVVDQPMLGLPIKLVHCADARKWPSDQHWSERYIFRKILGGGCIFTHSHELNHAAERCDKKKFQINKTKKFYDIDENEVITFINCTLGGAQIVLDLFSESPLRYWEYSDVIFKFYGTKNLISKKKEMCQITPKQIDQSYIRMWEKIVSKETNIRNNNWMYKYDL